MPSLPSKSRSKIRNRRSSSTSVNNSPSSSRPSSPFFGIVKLPSTKKSKSISEQNGINNKRKSSYNINNNIGSHHWNTNNRKRDASKSPSSLFPSNSIGSQSTTDFNNTGGLCGGTDAFHCDDALPIKGSCNTLDADNISRSNNDLATIDYNGGGNKHMSHIIEPYAVRHDEIVTALIDEALQNSINGGSGTTSNTIERDALNRSINSFVSATELPTNNNNIEGTTTTTSASEITPKKPRSPYRMKRNISKQLSNVSSPKLRKRQNSDVSTTSTKRSPAAQLKSAVVSRMPSNLSSSSRDNNNHTNMSSSHTSSKMNNATTVNPVDFFHPECILQKEKQKTSKLVSVGFGSSSTTDNESSNSTTPSAIGREKTLIKLQQKLSMLGDIESGKYGKAAEMLRSDAVAFIIKQQEYNGTTSKQLVTSKNNKKLPSISKVETRSILTLRMGFVSMSYGILLQWDTSSRLVELIVLRKMCRDDFLTRGGGNDMAAISSSSSSNRAKRDIPLANRPPLPTPKKSDTQVVVHHMGGQDKDRLEDGSKTKPGASTPEHGHNRFAFPRLSLPAVPRLFGESTNTKPQSFLSVSVLNVKGLHNVCDHCRNHNSVGRMLNGARLGAYSKRKRSHPTVRPYIRFVLGKHEHCTKVTKFNDGNPKWSKRHHNSCLLPCPPEELRWFAGREDLIVEVRNAWKKADSGSDSWFGGSSNQHGTTTSNADHPVLAAVTVPLSSVNIEDEENDIKVGRADSEGTWKRRTHKDGASSTNITIPIRMSNCQSAPIGSISLKITIKVPSQTIDTNTAVDKSNIEVQISASEGDTNQESIELGPLTRLMESLGGGGSATKEPTPKKNSHTSIITHHFPSKKNAESESAAAVQNKKSVSPRSSMKIPNIRWNKQFNHQTKKWSVLKPKSNGNTQSSTKKADDGGWFTFLNRDSTTQEFERKR